MRYLLLTTVVIFCITQNYAQKSFSKYQFEKVDAHVKTISQQLIYHPDILVDSLISPFDNDYEKARAIYSWIATNIEYNLIGYKNGWLDTQNINEVLLSGKALCAGFSMLFDHFCDKAGISCEIIEGYAKGYGYEEEQKFDAPNHAWNTVCIDGRWYLVDVTWAAGISDDPVRGERNIDLETYFFTDPQIFIKAHLPEDPTWQLLDAKQTLREFEEGSMIKGNNSQINTYSPVDYMGMSEYDKDVLRYKRSLQFNSDNVFFNERLSFAYIYKGISLTDGLWKMSFEELAEKSVYLNILFQSYLDSAWMLIEPLPLIRIQKSRRIIEDEINYQKGVFHYELGTELFNKGYNNKRSIRQISDLTSAYFTIARQHFDDVLPSSIYAKDARDYLEIINRYESRLQKP